MAKRVHPFTQPTAAGDLPLEIVQPPKPSADSLARANAAIGEWLIVDRRGYEACRDDCRGPKLQLDILAEHVTRAIDEAVAAERKRAQDVVEALGHTKIADAAAGSSGPQ